jgi:hypothetical protein
MRSKDHHQHLTIPNPFLVMARHQESLVNLSPVLFNNKPIYHTEITNFKNRHRNFNNGCQM